MNTTTLLTIIATLADPGLAGPGVPPPADTLTYGLPSPPAAVYHMTDSLAVGVALPGAGNMDVTLDNSARLSLAFRTDPGGVRVTGTLDSFEGSVTGATIGTETATIDDVSGSFDVVIGRSGVGELLSFPRVTGAMSQTALFPLLSFLLFPRLPDGEADPGATWVDTATASGNAGDMTTTSTLVTTATLVGDTLVDGRALVHIAVTREVTINNEMGADARGATQAIAGSANGFVLWDPERGLVAYAEFDQDFEGETTVPGVGTIDLTIAGTSRIRLEG